MHRVRRSVQENRLISTKLTERDYLVAIEATGRGWVLELEGNVVAFAIGNAANGSIWALFVEPGYEGRGYGQELHDIMIAWLWEQGHDRLWLSTDAGTRAERFYLAAGWRRAGVTEGGEICFELSR